MELLLIPLVYAIFITPVYVYEARKHNSEGIKALNIVSGTIAALFLILFLITL